MQYSFAGSCRAPLFQTLAEKGNGGAISASSCRAYIHLSRSGQSQGPVPGGCGRMESRSVEFTHLLQTGRQQHRLFFDSMSEQSETVAAAETGRAGPRPAGKTPAYRGSGAQRFPRKPQGVHMELPAGTIGQPSEKYSKNRPRLIKTEQVLT